MVFSFFMIDLRNSFLNKVQFSIEMALPGKGIVSVISHILPLGLIIGLFKSFASYIQLEKVDQFSKNDTLVQRHFFSHR